jgi:hypothetical protein
MVSHVDIMCLCKSMGCVLNVMWGGCASISSAC